MLFSKLATEECAKDPLISACEDLSARLGRDPTLGRTLERWTAPLFANVDKKFDRLRRAACYLADTGWRGHPDHRSEQSYTLVLNSPFIGVDHNGRALLALASYHRYGGGNDPIVRRVERYIGQAASERAAKLGLALRAGLALSEGLQHEILAKSTLKLTPSSLILTLPKSRIGRQVMGPLEEMSDAFSRALRIELR